MIMKKDALQPLMGALLGAPVNVVTGFIRNIRINVPWSEILSKPCEVYLDDIHVICSSPAKFDKEFAMQTYHKLKTAKFEQLLKEIKA